MRKFLASVAIVFTMSGTALDEVATGVSIGASAISGGTLGAVGVAASVVGYAAGSQ